MQATESQRHLAEYLLKANQAQLDVSSSDEPSEYSKLLLLKFYTHSFFTV